MIHRGGIYWADLGEASGSKPAKRRPVLVIQSRAFNASRLSRAVAAVITSNTRLAAMPGNVFIPAAATGLPRDSVVNVTALVTLDKTGLGTQACRLPDSLMDDVQPRTPPAAFPVARQEHNLKSRTTGRRRTTRGYERMFGLIAVRFVLADTEGWFWIKTAGALRQPS